MTETMKYPADVRPTCTCEDAQHDQPVREKVLCHYKIDSKQLKKIKIRPAG